jgi:hypothetical protein
MELGGGRYYRGEVGCLNKVKQSGRIENGVLSYQRQPYMALLLDDPLGKMIS